MKALAIVAVENSSVFTVLGVALIAVGLLSLRHLKRIQEWSFKRGFTSRLSPEQDLDGRRFMCVLLIGIGLLSLLEAVRVG